MKISPPAIQNARVLCQRMESSRYGLGPLVDLATLVANADGTIDPDEMQVLCEALDILLGAAVDQEMAQRLVEASQYMIGRTGAAKHTSAIGKIFAECSVADEAILFGASIGHASGRISDAEREVLHTLGKSAGVGPGHIDELIARGRSSG